MILFKLSIFPLTFIFLYTDILSVYINKSLRHYFIYAIERKELLKCHLPYIYFINIKFHINK